MTTLADHKAETGKPWKQIERDLTQILASHGEPPIYANRLNRLRSGKSKPSIAEVRALLEYVGLFFYKLLYPVLTGRSLVDTVHPSTTKRRSGMNKQNVLEAARKMSAGGFQSDKAAAKIEQGFVDGDVIPMSTERCIKIEGDKAAGYKGDIAENSFNLADMPESQLEQLMAAYIVKHYQVTAQKFY